MLQSEKNSKVLSVLDKLKKQGTPSPEATLPLPEGPVLGSGWDVSDDPEDYTIDPKTGKKILKSKLSLSLQQPE